MVQLTTPDGLRGRVAGIYNLVFIGGGAIGGPLVGWIAEHYGARVGLLLAGLIPATATIAIAAKLARSGRLRLVVLRPTDRRSPWRQPPLRVQLTHAPIRVARPEGHPIGPERPPILGRRLHQRGDSTPHSRPRKPRKPLHH
jgi:MFS family permease